MEEDRKAGLEWTGRVPGKSVLPTAEGEAVRKEALGECRSRPKNWPKVGPLRLLEIGKWKGSSPTHSPNPNPHPAHPTKEIFCHQDQRLSLSKL